jgi:phospholipase/carboxylesterase
MNTPKLSTNVEPLKWVGPDEPDFARSGLVHYIHTPKVTSQAQPIPAVVMIHGWGGDETVMWIFKQTLPSGVAIITPRAPFSLDQSGFVWFHDKGEATRPTSESLETALARLRRFLGSLPELYPIDPTRLLLMGFSQGAAVINALASTQPQVVSEAVGLVLMAGAIPDSLNLAPPPAALAGLPVFIAHGTEDAIIPLSTAQRVRDWYTELQAEVTYKEYPTGHKMNSQGMKDLTTWLAQRFQARPGESA